MKYYCKYCGSELEKDKRSEEGIPAFDSSYTHGFLKSLLFVRDFWDKYMDWIKVYKLNNYKGIKLILQKMIENREKFMHEGETIELLFKEDELPIRKKK